VIHKYPYGGHPKLQLRQTSRDCPIRTYRSVVLSKRGRPSPSTSHAHRPRRPVLSPSRVPIALPLERGTLADLAVAAPLPLMHIRTIRVRRLPLPLRRRSPAVAHRGIQRRRPRALDMAHGRLFGPGLAGVGVCVDVRDDGSGGAGGVGGGVFGGGGRVGGLGGDLGAVGGGGGDVAVAFEDFFGGDVGGVVEEGGVAEDGLEVFGDLLGGGMSVGVGGGRGDGRQGWGWLTSHIWSLYSMRVLTASMPRKLSSETTLLVSWSLRMLGLMTVARLWVSILLPLSSSTCENEDTQTRNEQSTSNESRWLFGRRQQLRWSTLRFFSSSAISGVKISISCRSRKRRSLTLRRYP